MDNPQVTQFEIGWLVGIFDGEGCYTLSKKSTGDTYEPGIKFVNTSDEIIEETAKILTSLEIPHYIYNSWRTKNQKPGKRIEINGLQRIKKFFDVLFQYLHCRYDQAYQLKRFVEIRLAKIPKEPYGPEEYNCVQRLRDLNRRGPRNLRD